MKNLFTILFLILLVKGLSAQIVDGNAFLKSYYIELGISSRGVYITDTIPGDYVMADDFADHSGFIGDYGYDGWIIGNPPYGGDYCAPGSPEESWGIEFDGNSYGNSSYDTSEAGIPGSIIEYLSSPDSVTAIWQGEINDVTFNQMTTIYPTDLYIITRVTITNNNAVDINNIYYLRNIDPDNEQQWSGDYTTNNVINTDLPTTIGTYGLTYGLYLGLTSADPSALCSYDGFLLPDTISHPYNGIPPYQTSGASVGDIAVQISFYTPTLAPGNSVTYVFAYVLEEGELMEANAATAGIPFIDICYFEDTIEISDIEFTEVTLNWDEYPDHFYELFITNTDDGTIDSISPVSEPLLLTGLNSCTNYSLQLSSFCDGETVYSEIFDLVTDCEEVSVTNIPENTNQIYPNPVSEIIHLEFGNTSEMEVDIRIFDIYGKLVFEKHQFKPAKIEIISVAGLEDGIYFISVEQDNICENNTIIITH